MPFPVLGVLGMLGRGAMAGYRTMRGIRAARAAQGAKMGYQRALGSQGAGLGSGTSGTGLQGLWQEELKSFRELQDQLNLEQVYYLVAKVSEML